MTANAENPALPFLLFDDEQSNLSIQIEAKPPPSDSLRSVIVFVELLSRSMSPLKNPTSGVVLGTGLAFAAIWSLKNLASNNRLDPPTSIYSVAASDANLNPAYNPILTLEEIEAPPTLDHLIQIPSDKTPAEQTNSPGSETLVAKVDEAVSPSRNREQGAELPVANLDGKPTQTDEFAISGELDPAQKSTATNPDLKSNLKADAPTRGEVGEVAEVAQVATIRTNQTSVAGFHSNPHFNISTARSMPANTLPTSSTASANLQSGDQAGSRSQPTSNEDDFMLELNESRISSEPSQFERILSQPIQFAQGSNSSSEPTTSKTKLKTAPQPTALTQSWPTVTLQESVAVRAVQHVEYGKTLARRGARSSAKQEFITALSIIAQDLDAQANTDMFSQSLRRGTLALKEAEEFVMNDSESQIGMDLSSLVDAHQCGAMTRQEAQTASSIQALQRYFGYAQVQIERGVGKNVVSAEALYCLGRLYTLQDTTGGSDGKLDRARSMVYHRASLSCDPSNYRSANELGVLLAEFGELNDSVNLLKASLRIRPTPNAWQNLAKVHLRLNQPQLAELASLESQRAQANQANGTIRWVEFNQFNADAAPEVMMAASPQSESSESLEAREANRSGATERKSLSDRVKSWF